MPTVNLQCPACGLSRTIPRSKIPAGARIATCPRCQHRFPLPEASAPPEPVPGEPRAALTLAQLFDRSWAIYRERWGTLTGLFLLIYLLVLVPTGLGLLFGFGLAQLWPGLDRALLVAGGLTGLATGMLVMFWGYAALLKAVTAPELDFRAALSQGWALVWPCAWALALTSLLIMGGMFLFFIPGFMMTVWFLFVPFILVEQEARGMAALHLSRHYVQGHFWDICGKFLIASLIPSALSAVPVAGLFLALLSVPYVMIMLFLVYTDQKLLRQSVAVAGQTQNTLLWWGLALLGYLLFLIPFLMLFSGTIITRFSSSGWISCITVLN